MHDVVAPLLERLGVPAIFFLIADCTDNRAMAISNQVALLASVAERANHSAQRAITAVLDKSHIPGTHLPHRILNLRHRHKREISEIANLLEVSIADYLRHRAPYLSSVQARDLASRGFHIGAHSVDHPYYQELSLSEQLRQTTESLRWVRAGIDSRCRFFAFPHSDADVSAAFYRELSAAERQLTLCFGTAGMVRDSVPFSFQRFSMEKDGIRAQRVLAQEYTRKLGRLLSGRNEVERIGASLY
jgi:peptidoglycan/xylan/chitin deacetylase (PgdA/CDA1 family)